MPKIIPKRTLEEIRFRNDIADVIQAHIPLKRAGSSFKACCPFHKEKTPSFHVNPQRQSFHCFGCGEGGDVFSFLMKLEGVDFTTAAKMLAQRAGMTLELEDDDGTGSSNKQKLYKIHEDLAHFYRRCLQQMASAAPARDYLAARKLDDDTCQDFLIGYAPNRWDTVLQWGRKNKVSNELLEEAGLILQSSRPSSETRYYDRFRNRIMFPIRDEQSRVIGFSGRAMSPEDPAKYLNSPETPLFHKSRVLYALEKARRSIVDTHEAILCEGQIDVIRCHEKGFTNAIAAQGTAFTEEHARIIKRYADNITLVFDADTAGQNAAVKAAVLFLDVGMAVRIAGLPPGEDPDSTLLGQGADAFRAILDAGRSIVDFQVAILSEREPVDSEVGVMRMAQAVLGTIRHSPNAVQRARMLQEAAAALNVPVAALESDLRREERRQQRRDAYRTEEPEPESAVTPIPDDEWGLCEHLARTADSPDVVAEAQAYCPVSLFSDTRAQRLAEAVMQAAASGTELIAWLRDAEADPETMRLASLALMSPDRMSAPGIKRTSREFSPLDAVHDYILCLWRRHFEAERAHLAAVPVTAETRERRAQLTHHLHNMRAWEHGAPIIEFEQHLAT